MHPLPSLSPRDVFDLLVGILVVAIGVAVVVARPREPANFFFAAFMGLLGMGLLSGVALYTSELLHRETRWALAEGLASPAELEASARSVLVSQRLFWVAYALDPIALIYFASIYPRRNRLHRPVVLLPFAALAVVFLLAGVFATRLPPAVNPGDLLPPFDRPALRAPLLVYVLGAYLLALHALAGDFAATQAQIARERGKLLVIGLGVAVFSRIGLAAFELLEIFRAGSNFDFPLTLLANTAIAGALAFASALGLFAAIKRSAPRDGAHHVAQAKAWTLWILAAIVTLVWLPVPLLLSLGVLRLSILDPTPTYWAFEILSRARYGSRWLVFGAFAGYSILRYQLFDLSARARRLSVEALRAAGLLGVFLLAAFGLVRLLPAEILRDPFFLIVGAAVAGVALVKAIDAIRIPAADSPGGSGEDAARLRLRKLEVYRAAVEGAIDRPAARGRIEELRRGLGIGEEEARAVERLVEAPPPTGGAILPGAVVSGRYEVDRILGRGGGGRVFLANDPLLGRRVVLKEVLDSGSGDAARALVEARIATRLSHPHIVTIHDTVRWGQDYVIVMEHCEGGSLRDHLRMRGALAPADAVRTMSEALSGLAAVHAKGIVHGDVKPANLLLDAEGRAKVADFGIARAARHAARTLEAHAIGAAVGGATPLYAPPEALVGKETGPSGDVYSAGMVLLECLTGPMRTPLAPQALLALAREVASPDLVAVAARATDTDPAARYPSAAEMLGALDASPEARWRRPREVEP